MEVDQISASASKSGPSNTHLDPPSTSTVESMDIDYGPALPPRLDSHSRVDDASGFNVLSRNPQGCPRLNQRNLVTLPNSMLWPRALPRTTTLTILMNLGLSLAEPRSILISRNTNPCPDIYLLPQRIKLPDPRDSLPRSSTIYDHRKQNKAKIFFHVNA